MTSLPTRLSGERLAEIAARDARWQEYRHESAFASDDCHALLAHVAALEGEHEIELQAERDRYSRMFAACNEDCARPWW